MRAPLASLALLAGCLLAGALQGCQSSPEGQPAPAATPAATGGPALASARDWPGVPNLRQSDQLYFAGQPEADGLRHAAAQGVTRVINLRDDDLSDVGYDEAALARELGLSYVLIPIRGKAFTIADAERFSAALTSREGPVLIHCRTGNRAGALWAVHLARHGGLALDAALEHGQAAGLASEGVAAHAREVAGAPR